ncbi:MAG TPA: LLM class flavin-dependent oxidoreductase [Thermomicrobiales bacterium]|nr:LLM class flavin-dependent oxidoreductase [Thermomicrobiales bacterium]
MSEVSAGSPNDSTRVPHLASRVPTFTFSLRLNNDLPFGDYARLATTAEASGFDQFWVSHDLFLRSSPVILTAVALATRTIQIGTCIFNPYTLHPSEIAMIAATLDEVSSGRFNLGIGAGAGEFMKWVGLRRERPMSMTRDAIVAIRAVLDGAPAPGWEPEAYLRFGDTQQGRRIPIYLAALSPGMLRLAGEVADGVLPLLFPPEHFATVEPLIRAGAEAAGRDMDAIDLAACVWCSVSEDRVAAEDALKDKIAYYGHALSPLIFDRLGLSGDDFRGTERALMTERDPLKARGLVTERMLPIGIVGTPADLIARMETLVAMGVRHLSFGPPLGPDPLAAVVAIGREVIPHFRGRSG